MSSSSSSAAGGPSRPASTSSDYTLARPHGPPSTPPQTHLERDTQLVADTALRRIPPTPTAAPFPDEAKAHMGDAAARGMPVSYESYKEHPRAKRPEKKEEVKTEKKGAEAKRAFTPLKFRDSTKITQRSVIPGMSQRTFEESIDKVKSVFSRIPKLLPKGTGKMFDRGWEETKEKLGSARNALSTAAEKGKEKATQAKNRVGDELSEAKKQARADLKRAKTDFAELRSSLFGKQKGASRSEEIKEFIAGLKDGGILVEASSFEKAKNELRFSHSGAFQFYLDNGRYHLMQRDHEGIHFSNVEELSKKEFEALMKDVQVGFNFAMQARKAELETIREQNALVEVGPDAQESQGEPRVDHYRLIWASETQQFILAVKNRQGEQIETPVEYYHDLNEIVIDLTGRDLRGNHVEG